MVCLECIYQFFTSGAISMGLGGYLAARAEIEHYRTERIREEMEVEECPQDEEEEIVEILEPYGLDRQTIQPIIEKLKSDPQKFVDFMMKFELNLEMPDPHRSWVNSTSLSFMALTLSLDLCTDHRSFLFCGWFDSFASLFLYR